jgi:hypothetical protein
MQDVDYVENAPDQGEPDCDAGIETAQYQAVGQNLKIDHRYLPELGGPLVQLGHEARTIIHAL